MRSARALAAVFAAVFAACTSKPLTNGLAVVTHVPSTGTAFPRTAITSLPSGATVTVMAVVQEGSSSTSPAPATAGTSDGLYVASALAGVAFAPDSLTTGGDTSSIGAVTAMTIDQDGSLLVAAAHGLYVSENDASGTFAPSPMASLIPSGTTILSMSSYGTGSSEQLWFVSSAGLFLVSDSAPQPVTLAGVGQPDAVVAIASNQAVVVSDAELLAIDLNGGSVLTIGGGLGRAYGATRDANGTAWFATDAGLVSFDSSGFATVQTFGAAAGSARVCGVAASGTTIYAAAATSLLSLLAGPAGAPQTGVASAVGTVSPSGACPMSADSDGNVYLNDSTGLGFFRNSSPTNVSFASQVEPLINGYCMTCHATGANAAPVIDFADYDTAKTYASSIAGDVSASPPIMPPPGNPQLTAAQIETIVSWCNGAQAP